MKHVNTQELCAGDLIKLLETLPYDTPIRIDASVGQPDSDVREEYVLVSGGFGRVDAGDGRGFQRTEEFILTAEFPDGTYETT